MMQVDNYKISCNNEISSLVLLENGKNYEKSNYATSSTDALVAIETGCSNDFPADLIRLTCDYLNNIYGLHNIQQINSNNDQLLASPSINFNYPFPSEQLCSRQLQYNNLYNNNSTHSFQVLPDSLIILIYQFLAFKQRILGLSHTNKLLHKLLYNNPSAFYYTGIFLPTSNNENESDIILFCRPIPIIQYKYIYKLIFHCESNDNWSNLLIQLSKVLLHLKSLNLYALSHSSYGLLYDALKSYSNHNLTQLTLQFISFCNDEQIDTFDPNNIVNWLPLTLMELTLYINCDINKFINFSNFKALDKITLLNLHCKFGENNLTIQEYNQLFIPTLLQFKSLIYLYLGCFDIDRDIDFSALNGLGNLKYLGVNRFNDSIIKLNNIQYLDCYDYYTFENMSTSIEFIENALNNMKQLICLHCNLNDEVNQEEYINYLLILEKYIYNKDNKLRYFYHNNINISNTLSDLLLKSTYSIHITPKLHFSNTYCFKSKHHKIQFYKQLRELKINDTNIYGNSINNKDNHLSAATPNPQQLASVANTDINSYNNYKKSFQLLPDSLIILIYQFINFESRISVLSVANKFLYKLLYDNHSAFNYGSIYIPSFIAMLKCDITTTVDVSDLKKFCFPIPIHKYQYLYQLDFNCSYDHDGEYNIKLLSELSNLLTHLQVLRLVEIQRNMKNTLINAISLFSNHKIKQFTLAYSSTFIIKYNQLTKVLPITLNTLTMNNRLIEIDDFIDIPNNLSSIKNITNLALSDVFKPKLTVNEFAKLYIPTLLQFKALIYLQLDCYYMDDDIDLSVLINLSYLKYLKIHQYNVSIIHLKQIEYLQVYDTNDPNLHSEMVNKILSNMPQLICFNYFTYVEYDQIIDYLLSLEPYIYNNTNQSKLLYFRCDSSDNKLVQNLLSQYTHIVWLTSKIDFEPSIVFNSKTHKIHFYQQLKLLKQNTNNSTNTNISASTPNPQLNDICMVQTNASNSTSPFQSLPDTLIILIYQFIEFKDRITRLSHTNKLFYKLLYNNPIAFYYSEVRLPKSHKDHILVHDVIEYVKPIPIIQYKYIYQLTFLCKNQNWCNYLIQLSKLLLHIKRLEIFDIPKKDCELLYNCLQSYNNHKLTELLLTAYFLDFQQVAKLNNSINILPCTLTELSLFEFNFDIDEFIRFSNLGWVNNLISLELDCKFGINLQEYNELFIPALLQFKSLIYLHLGCHSFDRKFDDNMDFSALNGLIHLKMLCIRTFKSFNNSICKLNNIEYLHFHDYHMIRNVNSSDTILLVQDILNNMKQLKCLNCILNENNFTGKEYIDYLLSLEKFFYNIDYNLTYFRNNPLQEHERTTKLNEIENLLLLSTNKVHITSKMGFVDTYCFKSESHKIQFYQQLKLLKQTNTINDNTVTNNLCASTPNVKQLYFVSNNNNVSSLTNYHTNLLQLLPDSLIILIYQFIEFEDRIGGLSHTNKLCNKLLYNNPAAFYHSDIRLPETKHYHKDKPMNDAIEYLKPIPILQYKYIYQLQCNCLKTMNWCNYLIQLSKLLLHVRSLQLFEIPKQDCKLLYNCLESYNNHKLTELILDYEKVYIGVSGYFVVFPTTLTQLSLRDARYSMNEFVSISNFAYVNNIISLELDCKYFLDNLSIQEYNELFMSALLQFKSLQYLYFNLVILVVLLIFLV